MNIRILILTIAIMVLSVSFAPFIDAQFEPTPTPAPSPTPSQTPSPTPSESPTPTPKPTPFVPDLSQVPNGSQLISLLTIASSPSSPSPNEQTTITAKTPTFDPNTAHFTWTVDGKKRDDLSGFGKNKFTITAGDAGSKMRVSVHVLSPKGQTLTSAYTMYVTDLTMTWIAQTYTPKWYKGKALPTSGSPLKIVAAPTIIIDGVTIPPEKLIYRWSVNGQKKLSGIGQQTFTTVAPGKPDQTLMYTVSIEDGGKRIKKEGRLGLTVVIPKAVIYQTLPLGGVEPRQAMRYASLAPGKSMDVQMEPFFYPIASRRDIPFEWTVSGDKVPGTAENPYFLTIAAPPHTDSDVLITGSIPGMGIFIPRVLTFLTIPKQ